MNIDVLTLFPNAFKAVTAGSIIMRAQKAKRVRIRIHNIRDYTKDKHRKVDGRPFGGGAGMVLNCQPVMDALAKIIGERRILGGPSVRAAFAGLPEEEVKKGVDALEAVLSQTAHEIIPSDYTKQLAKMIAGQNA